MKFLSLVLIVLSSQFASAAPVKGTALKNAITKMKLCVGVRDLDGYVIYFAENNQAYVSSLTPEATKAISVFADKTWTATGSYSGIYEKYLEVADFVDTIDTTWSVSNSQVLVRLGGKKSAKTSLSIGMTSQYCNSQY